jgi:transcriptional regulator with XRE-family HTH domain
MLAPYQVDHIRKLLFEKKLSSRQIARRTGVSRGAIAEIAAGRRPVEATERSDEAEDDFEVPLDPPQRCPTCGDWVFPPCRLCRTRALLRKHLGHIARLPSPQYPFLLGLDLKPRHRARYEQVRRQRRVIDAAAG